MPETKQIKTKDPNDAESVHRPQGDLPFRIEHNAERKRYLKLLVYGNYGSGKTTLAATAADVDSMRDVLMLSAESGDLAVEDVDMDVVTVQNYRVLAKIYEFLRQHCIARDANDVEKLQKLHAKVTGQTVDEPPRYYTVIIDSLTEIEAFCMNQLLGVTDVTKLDDEVQSAEWAEYKKNNNMITRLVRNFRDLPIHVIFVASEQYNQDETKKYRYSPNLTGKLSKQVQGFFDMVGYLVVGQAKENSDEMMRRLYVQPNASGRFDAKHRYKKFKGAYFDNPTIGTILKQTGLANTKGGK